MSYPKNYIRFFLKPKVLLLTFLARIWFQHAYSSRLTRSSDPLLFPFRLDLKTALVERNDFSAGTSSRSTKLIHGGVRYLQKAIMQLDYEQVPNPLRSPFLFFIAPPSSFFLSVSMATVQDGERSPF